MVEFSLSQEPDDYSGPIDDDPRIEEPIVPISELGTTVTEHGPQGQHILQNIEAAIRKGTSVLQLAWQTQSNSPMGGRAKAYGKDVRQAIREMLEANEVDLVGAELPTSSNTNMSGFDMQRGTISEEKRQRDLQEVKDAIDFQVDVAGGGGVDIWSQEYARSISDDSKLINNDKKNQFYDYSEEELKYEKLVHEYANEKNLTPKKRDEYEEKMKKFENRIEGVKYLYDSRTGQVIKDIKKSSVIQAPIYLTADRVEGEINQRELKKNGDGRKKKIVGTYSKERAEANGGDGIIKETDFVDLTGKWLNPEEPADLILRVPEWNEKETKFNTEQLKWQDIVRRQQEHNKTHEKQITPEEMAFKLQMDTQILRARGQSLFYTRQYEEERDNITDLQNMKEDYEDKKKELQKIFKNDEEGYNFALKQEAKKLAGNFTKGPEGQAALAEKISKNPDKFFEKNLRQAQHNLKHVHEASAGADAQADELLKMEENVTTPDRLAFDNTTASYAELGMYAMEKGKDKKSNRDSYVGPELGWPTAFGGHPKEFIKIIKESRSKMADQLLKKGYSPSEAKAKAKSHIKGDFDTSHMAMWYNHFQKKEGESEEKKLKRFNKWYIDQVEEMRKEDVIGSIQVVDAISGQHAHLPPGQGIFPVVDAVKHLKSKGWKGDVVSEGHEEEKFGEGRILTETWKAFGSPIGSGYWGGGSTPGRGTWGGVQQSYFGATQSPTYIVGAYVPSNEWSLWSETPFE